MTRTVHERAVHHPPAFKRPPANDRASVCGMAVLKIHNLPAQQLKPFRRERLREEVRVVIVRVNQRHDDFLGIDHVPNEEVPPLDMFRSIMVLGIVGQVPGRLVIC